MNRLLVALGIGVLAIGAGEVAAQGYGRAVAVAGDQLLVGQSSFGSSPGIVHVYERTGDGWTDSGSIMSPASAEGDGFGWALSVDGDRLLVSAVNPRGGSGGVYVFSRTGGGWEPSGELSVADLPDGMSLGVAVALAGDVALVTSGSPRLQGEAQVHVFRNQGGTWTADGTLDAPPAQGRSLFGATLLLSDDRAYVADPFRGNNAGAVFVYGRSDTGFELQGELTIGDGEGSLLGAALASTDGEVLVGAGGVEDNRGAVVRFSVDDEGWTENGRLMPFDGTSGASFGSALAADGGRLLVGAPGHDRRGAIYAFEDGEAGSWSTVHKLSVPDLKVRAGLGTSLAAGPGLLVSGLPGDDYGAGTARVFEEIDGAWTPTGSLFTEIEGYEPVVGGQLDCEGGEAHVFGCSDVDLVSFVPVADLGGGRGTRVNDVWGWTDPESDREYAIVGRTDGTSFVDISDPYNPVYLGNLPKTADAPGSTWRDMKVYQDHVFVVSDGADHHGMQVFDLTRLRDVNGEPRTFDADAHYDGLYSVHNIVINEETGFAYAVGSRGGGETCGGGLHIIDIRDPKSPTFAGCFADTNTGRQGTGYTHDAQCVVYQGPDTEHQGKEICFGANETALSIADVTHKDSTVALSMASYPNVGYSHQGWLTEDHAFFYMNDELDELQGSVPSTRTLIWDVRDLDDPILVKEHQSENRASDHNLYVRGNLMYQSNYQSGLRVLDISDVENPREIAYFDTVPGEDAPGMGGAWSSYPFFESGIVIVTSGNEGLFLVRRTERTPVS